jgi:hypothetical protein
MPAWVLTGLLLFAVAGAQNAAVEVDLAEGTLDSWSERSKTQPVVMAHLRNTTNQSLIFNAKLVVPQQPPAPVGGNIAQEKYLVTPLAEVRVAASGTGDLMLPARLNYTCISPDLPVWLVLTPTSATAPGVLQKSVWQPVSRDRWSPNLYQATVTFDLAMSTLPRNGMRFLPSGVLLRQGYRAAPPCSTDSSLPLYDHPTEFAAQRGAVLTVPANMPGASTFVLRNAQGAPLSVVAYPLGDLLHFALPAGVSLRPGTYQGRAPVVSGETPVTVNLNVRWPIGWAVILILVAVFLGWLVPYLQRRVNGGLELLHDVAGVRRSARSLVDAPRDARTSSGYLGASALRQRLHRLERAVKRRTIYSSDFDRLMRRLWPWSATVTAPEDVVLAQSELSELRRRLTEEEQMLRAWQAFRASWRVLRTQLQLLEAGERTYIQGRLEQITAVLEGRFSRGSETSAAQTVNVTSANIQRLHTTVNDAAELAALLRRQPPSRFDATIQEFQNSTNLVERKRAEVLKRVRSHLRHLGSGKRLPPSKSLKAVSDEYAAKVSEGLTLTGLLYSTPPEGLTRPPLLLSEPQVVAQQSVRRVGQSRYETWRLWVGLLLFTLMTVFTLVTGLKALYVSNSTFGASWWDMFAVLAWGLGLAGSTSLVLQFLNALQRTPSNTAN